MTRDADVTILRPDTSGNGASLGIADDVQAGGARVLKQRFVLEEKMGSGGMGTVFRARDLRKVEARDRNPFVAVKVLNQDFQSHPEAFMALEREASKSQTLSHPNIVSIFDFDKDGDTPFMTMELLQGRELAELLQQFPDGVPNEMAWPIIEGLCSGLRYAHEAGVVHADFKPGNVFVSAQHHPKILDFGIARAVQINQQRGEDTVFDPQRLAALTPAYASLEMLEGETPELGDDIYSLGVVIYQVLTGRHPYDRHSAKEAFEQGLRPERPKRISRQQWRILDQCLSLRREKRPLDVADVQRTLFQPSPWQSRTAAIAAAAVVFALAVNFLQGEAQLTEVKQEVRATTLLDAQAARLDTLLEQPSFDAGWHNTVAAEMQTLDGLVGAHTLSSGFTQRILAVYTDAVISNKKINAALALYENGLQFGELDQAGDELRVRLEERIQKLLDAPVSSVRYLLRLDSAFKLALGHFPDHNRWAELNLVAVDVLETLVRKSVADGELSLADQAMSRLTPRMFLYPTLASLERKIADSRSAQLATDVERQKQAAEVQFESALSGLFSGSCLRMNVNDVESRYTDLAENYPDQSAVGRQRVDDEMLRCVNQLRAVDQDRAQALQTEALSIFGELPKLAAVRLDPCAQGYLVGNGAQAGRRGYCVDALALSRSGGSSALTGPKLVVIPATDTDPIFAIMKEEAHSGLMALFCEEGAGSRELVGCGPELPSNMPLVNISLTAAEALANWLSDSSGYRYRIASRAEWLRAVSDSPDPNRNCRVQLAGVERGLAPLAVDTGQAGALGLIHALGNVREWVTTDAGPLAVGGSFRDPLGECLVETAASVPGQGDNLTGLRLVREIP